MTLNQFKQLFTAIGDAHYFIKTTEFGEPPSKVEANTEATIYPAFYQVITDTINREQTIERTFTLIVCDLVYPDKSNLDEVLSDTEQTLNDIIKIFRQESDDYTLIGDPQMTDFKDRYGDAVAGWQVDVTIESQNNSAFCDIPSDIFGYGGSTTPTGQPLHPFDCDSLNDCSVINEIEETLVELQEEIDNINIAIPLNEVAIGGGDYITSFSSFTYSNNIATIGSDIRVGEIGFESAWGIAAINGKSLSILGDNANGRIDISPQGSIGYNAPDSGHFFRGENIFLVGGSGLRKMETQLFTDTGDYGGFEIAIDEDASGSSFYRYYTTGNIPGSSIAWSGMTGLNVWTGDQDTLSGLPLMNRATTIYNFTSSTGTDYGTKLDSTGFRIGAISGLNTSNTVIFQAALLQYNGDALTDNRFIAGYSGGNILFGNWNSFASATWFGSTGFNERMVANYSDNSVRFFTNNVETVSIVPSLVTIKVATNIIQASMTPLGTGTFGSANLNIAGNSGDVGITMTHGANNGTQRLLMTYDATRFGGIAYYSPNVVGTNAKSGTNLASSITLYNNSSTVVLDGTTILALSGTNANHYGMRIDTVGVRFSANGQLASANTNYFGVGLPGWSGDYLFFDSSFNLKVSGTSVASGNVWAGTLAMNGTSGRFNTVVAGTTGTVSPAFVAESYNGAAPSLELRGTNAYGGTKARLISYTGTGGGSSGNYTGTTIPKGPSVNIDSSATYAGESTAPLVSTGSVLYGLSGVTGTNYGYRLDSAGFRIDLLSALQTTNTHLFNVKSILTVTTTKTTITNPTVIGSLTPTYGSGESLNVVFSSNFISGSYIENQSTGNAAGAASIFVESTTKFAIHGRLHSSFAGNFGGTSIARANTAYYENTSNNQTSADKFFMYCNPIYFIGSSTATSIGTKIDTNGLRIDQIQNLHTANSNALEVNNGTVKFGNLSGTGSAFIQVDSAGLLSRSTVTPDSLNYSQVLFVDLFL